MPSDFYKNDLSRCSKCDCFILDDFPDEKIGLKSVNEKNVKVYIKRNCNCENLKTNSIGTVFLSEIDKAEDEMSDDDSGKNGCLCWGRKKGDTKNEASGMSHSNMKNTDAQTLDNVSVKKPEDLNVVDLMKTVKTGSGGGNTNTIIFPRDQCGGDNLMCLQNWLRMEAKCNGRNLEDLCDEMHKIRREIADLKDMLETVLKYLREPIIARFPGRKNMAEMERKSDPVSLRLSKEKPEAVDKKENVIVNKSSRSVEAAPPQMKQEQEQKKKKFCFPWCK